MFPNDHTGILIMNKKSEMFSDNRSTDNPKRIISGFIVLLFSIIILALSPGETFAQTGLISGTITDAETEETLPGANVIIQGTRYGVSTDVDGRYTIRRVPVGEHTIVVTYMGFEHKSFDVVIEEDVRLNRDVSLQPSLIEGDEIFVLGVQRGQARSLTRQRESINIRNVVSAEQIDRFADQTIGGALQRVAGMGHGGEANIRGIGRGMSRVTVDGQRMGSTGSDRSVDLATISADMVQELDVIKVITPDMSADALSGVINISTRRPIGGERTMNIRGGGGYQPRYLEHTGAGSRLSFSYGDSPDDSYSYGLNFSYQRDPRGSESVHTSWVREGDRQNLGEPYGIVDLVDDVESRYNFGVRQRYGAGGQFTFQPTDRSTYHFQGMFNYQDRKDDMNSVEVAPRSSHYTTPWQTGPTDTDYGGTMSYDARFQRRDIYQFTLQAGGRHLLDRMDMGYRLGWGHGRSYRDDYRLSWTNDRPMIDFLVNTDDRFHPVLEIAPHSSRITYPGSSAIAVQDFLDYRDTRHTDNEINATLDFEAPYTLGTVKFGASLLSTFQQGRYERYDINWDGREGPANFPQMLNPNWNVFDREGIAYEIPYLIDSDKFIDLFNSRFPNLVKHEINFARSSETSYYDGNENVLATYAMGRLSYGIFTFLGGARVEHFMGSYNAREVMISAGGEYLGATPSDATSDYTHLFPNAQILINITPRTNFRTAYSRSIGRPTFTQLSPYREFDYDSRNVVHGNPNLKPMVSDNLDVLFEHYFMDVGQFTIGLFYKQLSDFVFRESRRLQLEGLADLDDLPDDPEHFVGWNRATYRNGEEAEVYGLEANWQQNLSFLPGFLGNIGTYFNYTYTYSEADIDRLNDRGETVYVRLQNQRPHIVNAGLNYAHGRFTGQISYQWSSPYVTSYASTRAFAPTIQLQERVYFDSYTDGANDLSLTLRYRVTDNFRIWFNGENLTNSRSVNYQYHQDYYPTSQTLSRTRVNLGIQITL